MNIRYSIIMLTEEQMMLQCIRNTNTYDRNIIYPCDPCNVVLTLRDVPIEEDLHWVILQMVFDLDEWRTWCGVPFT